ncbi:transcriptional regulator family: C2H2 zinc finger [Purpureocillium lilacinum]|uniref:Transcriptional regulator family: C2H2 zinc finger n=1 Tax=Purpureocillium lilacinum TaxID=33203 RepID=A0ABR0BEN5_PURLI|nr:transcriptional regulator family: C2H2 zinc finger [Purpureocillium lilacinum]
MPPPRRKSIPHPDSPTEPRVAARAEYLGEVKRWQDFHLRYPVLLRLANAAAFPELSVHPARPGEGNRPPKELMRKTVVMVLQETAQQYAPATVKGGEKSGNLQCALCNKHFTRGYNLRSHLRTHTNERPFACPVCGKAFARQHDCKRHEQLHSGERKFVCGGALQGDGQWGCGRAFTRVDALARHLRSIGNACIKPLLEGEMGRRPPSQQPVNETLQPKPPLLLPSAMEVDVGHSSPVEGIDDGMLPVALPARYPSLADTYWPWPGTEERMYDLSTISSAATYGSPSDTDDAYGSTKGAYAAWWTAYLSTYYAWGSVPIVH